MRCSILTMCILYTMILASCGGKQPTGTTFSPQERTSSLSDEERELAIAQKHDEATPIDVETLVSSHSIRLTILPPAMQDEITEGVEERIVMKMLQIATKNGVSGVNGSSPIAFAMSMQPSERAATGSAPQKMMIKYDVVYYVLNMQSMDVFASVESQITGVGASFEDAAINAVEEINDSQELQQMFSGAEARILSWFNENTQELQNRVNQALANKDFALAMAILRSVPEQATTCYSWSSKQQPGVIDKFKQQVAHDELAAMKDAIAAAMAEYNPAVAAHMAMLPVGTPEAKEGAALYSKYLAQIDQERLRKLDAEERQRLEELEMEKLQMKYEAEAAGKQTTSGNKSNFGSKFRSFFAGAGVMSIVGNVLSRCLWIL